MSNDERNLIEEMHEGQRAHDVLQHQPPPPGEERRAWLDKLLKNIIE